MTNTRTTIRRTDAAVENAKGTGAMWRDAKITPRSCRPSPGCRGLNQAALPFLRRRASLALAVWSVDSPRW